MRVYELKRDEELADIKELMGSVTGRRFIYRLLKKSGCLDSPQIITDPLVVNHLEGQRSIGFDIFREVMDVAPKKFIAMIMEAKEAIKHTEQLLEAERKQEEEKNNV